MFLKGFNLNFKYISIQSTKDDGNNHSELGSQRTEEELTKVLSVAFSFMKCFLVFKEESPTKNLRKTIGNAKQNM